MRARSPISIRGGAVIALSLLAAGCAQLRDNAVPEPSAELNAQREELGAIQQPLARFAKLSWAAYHCPSGSGGAPPPDQTDPGTQVACFSVDVPDPLAKGPAVYFIETNDHGPRKEQVIAIRGTDTIGDFIRDGETIKRPDDLLKVRDHPGFQNYAHAIFRDIIANDRLLPGYRITLTGHSLGGAAAVLVGLYLYTGGYADRIDAVYTYGQPKVFDSQGSVAWPRFASRVVRAVSCGDPVAIVPENDAGAPIFWISFSGNLGETEYRHMGRTILLMDDGKFWISNGSEVERDLRRNVAAMIHNIARRGPFDHQICSYRTRIEELGRKLPEPHDPFNIDSVCRDVTHPICDAPGNATTP